MPETPKQIITWKISKTLQNTIAYNIFNKDVLYNNFYNNNNTNNNKII